MNGRLSDTAMQTHLLFILQNSGEDVALSRTKILRAMGVRKSRAALNALSHTINNLTAQGAVEKVGNHSIRSVLRSESLVGNVAAKSKKRKKQGAAAVIVPPEIREFPVVDPTDKRIQELVKEAISERLSPIATAKGGFWYEFVRAMKKSREEQALFWHKWEKKRYGFIKRFTAMYKKNPTYNIYRNLICWAYDINGSTTAKKKG